LAALTQPASNQTDSTRWTAPRDEAEALAHMLPPLLVAAEAAASSVALGVHGRRKAGMGETFWQFRRYRSEDPAQAVDWRQSARSQHLFVREREWEVAETVRIWRDASAGMQFSSSRDVPTKMERGTVIALAMASLLLRGGERVGLHGDAAPASTGRGALYRMAQSLADDASANIDSPLPDVITTKRHDTLIWVSDFLQPLADIEARMSVLASAGVRGFLVVVNDPAEEDFPFEGRAKFASPDDKFETRIFGRAESVAEEYRLRFGAHVEAVGLAARRLNWSLTRHRTDRPPQTALIALYTALGGPRAARGF